VPFQPTTQRTFSKDDTLRIYSRAYWGGADATLPFEIAISDTNSPLLRNVAAPASMNGPGRRRADLDATLSLSTLSPGAHVLAVTTHIGRDKPVRREIPFVLR